MSSDEEDGGVPVVKKPKKLVHFGSLADAGAIDRMKDLIAEKEKASSSGNIHVSKETLKLDDIASPHRDAMMAEFERRRRARTMTLPTDDIEVRMMLRQLDQPICLFGEDKPDRRERLRAILSSMDEDDVTKILHREQAEAAPQQRDESTWYHEGPWSLREARVAIADYSLPRAKERLERAREETQKPPQQKALKLQETHKWIRDVGIYGSQVGDNRPLSFCEFAPDSKHLVTSGWSGLCKLWSVPDCRLVKTYRGHNAQAGCARFHPGAYQTMDAGALNVASCGHDGSVLLWSLENEEPIGQLEGHGARVSRLAFHPSGRFLATCCFDASWRLFDLEVNDEVLFQEGHSKAVFDLDFQCDGSLALTGGMDCYGRVWDLRTGRCIMFLEGHQKEILTVGWAPNGYEMATGSGDNSCKIWDLRMRRCVYTMPAHQSLVSRLKFDGATGNYMVTSSFDSTIKIWTLPGWQTLRKLEGHDSKVMSVDVSPDGSWIASAGFDRTFKLWTRSDTAGL